MGTGIFAAMCSAMTDITAIAKNQVNTTQGFKFRGIDAVYNELHDILAKHKIFTVPEVLTERTEERVTKSGSALIYRIFTMKYTFYHEDGSSVSCTVMGEGMDSGDKAGNKAMSIAHKYALFQTFLIPTEDEKDPDAESHEVKPKKPALPKSADNLPPASSSKDLTQAEMKTEIYRMLFEMCIDEATVANELEKLTTWEKDGTVHPGKRSVGDLAEKQNAKGQSQTSVVYHQVKKQYEAWLPPKGDE